MDQRNFLYMFYGFLAAWMVVIVYVFTLIGRERRMRKEIDSLKRIFEDKSSGESQKASTARRQ